MFEETGVNEEHVEATILSFIRDELNGGRAVDFDVDENLLTSGLVDSVGIARLIAHVQDELGVVVPPTELIPANFRTIRVMAAYLHGLRAA